PHSPARRRQDRRLAEVVDLIWQTDELRLDQPTPVDEARNATYYLDKLFAGTVPELLDELAADLADWGAERPDGSRPLVFGTWIGGDRDGNPNVTPQVTTEVLLLQHGHAIRTLIDILEELLEELSNSVRLAGVDPRLRRLNAAEPYRQKATCIQ